MSKPLIIAYEFDHSRAFTGPQMPEVHFDSDGIKVPRFGLTFDGYPIEEYRLLEPGEVDAWFRFYGMKRVYAPRPFRARRWFDGYLITCRSCDRTFPGKLPHDAAARHDCAALR
jgi:hypothetical protein